MKVTAREGFRLAMTRPVVRVIIAISLVAGLAAEAFDRLRVPSVINRFVFPTVFGSDNPFDLVRAQRNDRHAARRRGLGGAQAQEPRGSGARHPGTTTGHLFRHPGCGSGGVRVERSLWLAFGVLWVGAIVDS
jgi:DHA3 family tetracycline resistance protein-like MFS transporter